MKPTILPEPVDVVFETVVNQIERFNRPGQNPYGPNVPVKSHAPLTLILQGPGIDVEVPFYAEDRPEELRAALRSNAKFQTRHAVIYPQTRTMISRQWHRVYAFDVERKLVIGVKLLVTRTQDPELLQQHPEISAWPWVHSINKSGEALAWGESLS
jgi:hypothetical protein